MSRMLQLAAKATHSFERGCLETLFTVIGVVQASNRLAVFLNHSSRVELRIDHDSVRRGMSEKSLDYVHRNVIVEMLGSEKFLRLSCNGWLRRNTSLSFGKR